MLLAASSAACSSSDRSAEHVDAARPDVAVAPVSATPAATAPAPSVPAVARPKIVCIGDSLTAGYGLARGLDYPSLLQKKLDEAGYSYDVVNAGVSGDTSAGGLRRAERAFAGDVRVVVVELGANDGLRGNPPAEVKRNVTAIVKAAKARGAAVLVTGMEAPPNMGEAYRDEFRQTFAEVADEQKVAFLPFFLEGVAGRFELNQADAIHPNAEGTRIVADGVFGALAPLLKK